MNFEMSWDVPGSGFDPLALPLMLEHTLPLRHPDYHNLDPGGTQVVFISSRAIDLRIVGFDNTFSSYWPQ